jgi:predicted nucleotidyltransferase
MGWKTMKSDSPQVSEAVKEFSKKVIEELGGKVDSIILYGSLARGEAEKQSDIDVLIVSRDTRVIERKVSDISYENDLKHETFTTLVFLSPDEIEQEIRLGSYFINDILTEGVVLYDNGTFKRIREKTLGVSR